MATNEERGGLLPSLLLGVATLVIVLGRWSDGEFADFLAQRVSLPMLPDDVEQSVRQLLMVPLASLIVVFCRLTLGIRMLGPFRPILIAVAMRETGALLGIGFLAVVLAIAVAMRPRLRGGWLPYFGRLSVLLSSLVVVLVAAVLVGANLQSESLENLAFFPIVVLCLMADGFARALDKEGLPSAVGRATSTVLTALVIGSIASIPFVQGLLGAYPELVFAELALILLVATRLRLGLLARFNPGMRGDDGE